MATASISTVSASTRQVAGPTAERLANAVMQAIKARFQHKPSAHLAEIIGCDISTAERYFAGARSPNFDAALAMLLHPVVGVTLLEEATRQKLSPKDYDQFWREMAKANLRAMARGEEEMR